MKEEKKKITTRLKDFVRRYIFFRVSKEEKDYIRETTMDLDHRAFKIMLFFIFILQMIMIAYKCISKQLNFNERDVGYLFCYILLAFFMIISSALIEFFYKKRKPMPYFVVTAITVNIFYIWAAAITILDSFRGHEELTTFAYVALALTSFIMLEPWVLILDVICYSTFLNVFFALNPDLHLYSSIIVSSISIAILSCIVTVINFVRRLNSMNLQKQVSELNVTLKSRAYYDDLTGVRNRRFLTEHIDDVVYFGTNSTGVLMFDIDGFKNINDTYGHQNGDQCLKIIGNILSDATAKHNDCYSVRFGGEEFLMYFKHIKKENLIEVAEILRKTVENTEIPLLEGGTIKLTISVGASSGKVGNNYTSLINKADTNLYQAKSSGKNRIYYE